RYALFGDVPAGEHHRRGPPGLDESAGPASVLAAQDSERAAEALLTQPTLVQPRETERTLRDQHAQLLYSPADGPTESAEILAPVLPGPDLVPVDNEAVAPNRPQRSGREEREIGKRRGVDRVVTASVPRQMREHAEAEPERRPDPPATVAPIELHPGPDRDHPHPGHARILALGPLAE